MLLSLAQVLLDSDADLAIGDFGIATRMVQREPGEARRPTAEPRRSRARP